MQNPVGHILYFILEIKHFHNMNACRGGFTVGWNLSKVLNSKKTIISFTVVTLTFYILNGQQVMRSPGEIQTADNGTKRGLPQISAMVLSLNL